MFTLSIRLRNCNCNFCVFTCFCQFLHDLIIKLFCWSTISGPRHAKTGKKGKYAEIKKQSDVKFWLKLNKIWSCRIFIQLYDQFFSAQWIFKILLQLFWAIPIIRAVVWPGKNHKYFKKRKLYIQCQSFFLLIF